MIEELFDKKYVHFMWSNLLDSTSCFVSNSIESLINLVNSGDINKRVYLDHIRSTNKNKPFRVYGENKKPKDYIFAYYDPNYEFKLAYNQGKQIQETIDFEDGIRQWIDVEYPNWNISYRHRIKPMNFIVYLPRYFPTLELNICQEDCWDLAPKEYGAKTKLFIGTEDDAENWRKTRNKFSKIIKAFEDGEDIEFYNENTNEWYPAFHPRWDVDTKYRVKPKIEELE